LRLVANAIARRVAAEPIEAIVRTVAAARQARLGAKRTGACKTRVLDEPSLH
jgi:hypothetical protein